MAIRTAAVGGVGLLVVLAMTHALVDAFAASVHPLWPDLQNRLSLGEGGIQAAFVLWNISTSASQLVFGFIGDRYRGGWLLWAGPLLGVVCMGMVGLSGSFGALGLLLMLGGLGVAAFHPEAAATAGAALPEARSRAMSIFATGGFLGQAMGPLGSGLISERFGLPALAWNVSWGLLVLLFLLPMLRQAPAPTGGSSRGQGVSALDLLRLAGGRVAVLAGVGTLRVLPAAGPPIALAFVLKDRGAGNDVIGAVQASFLLGIGLGGLACAAVVHRGMEKRLLWLLPIVVAPLLVVCPMLDGWAMRGVAGLMGGLVGLGLPVFISYGQQLLPEGQRVASSLTMGVTWGLGGTVVAGIMAVCTRVGRPDAAFLAFAVGSALAGLSCLRLPEPGRHLASSSASMPVAPPNRIATG